MNDTPEKSTEPSRRAAEFNERIRRRLKRLMANRAPITFPCSPVSPSFLLARRTA